MFRKIAAKHLRTGAWLAAGGGILFSFVFHARELYSFNLLYLIRDILTYSNLSRDIFPYFIIAIAAAISRTRAMAWISLVASFTVLALSVYAYIHYYRVVGTILDDFALYVTDPLKWWIALIVLVIAISVLYFRGSKIHEEFSNPAD